jgi:hypothetical protein
MNSVRKRGIVALWGLIFMVCYLYACESLNAIRFKPTPTALPEHSVEGRAIPIWLFWAATKADKALWNLSFPTAAFSQRFLMSETYYSWLIYTPFINAFQWFLYGSLFGLWRYKKGTRASTSG